MPPPCTSGSVGRFNWHETGYRVDYGPLSHILSTDCMSDLMGGRHMPERAVVRYGPAGPIRLKCGKPRKRARPLARGRGLRPQLTRRGNCLSKILSLPSVTTVGRRARSVPPATSGGQKTGCANRNFWGRSEVPEAGAVPGVSGPQAAIATRAQMRETNQRHEFMGVLHNGDIHPPPCGSAASLVIGPP